MNGASGWVRSGSVRDPRTVGLRPVQPAMALPGEPSQEVDGMLALLEEAQVVAKDNHPW